MSKLLDRSPDNIKRIGNMIMGMNGRVSQLLHLEAGIDLLRSDRSYDIALVAKFATLDDLQAYQMHPVHVKFKEDTKAQIEHSVSVDYLSD